jgi:hypothetical protein
LARYVNRKLEWKRSEEENFEPAKWKPVGTIASLCDCIRQLISFNRPQNEHGRLKSETKQIEAEMVTSLIRQTATIR